MTNNEPKPEYKPTGKTEAGRAECKRLIELALLRGWARRGNNGSVSKRAYEGKGRAWGWGESSIRV